MPLEPDLFLTSWRERYMNAAAEISIFRPRISRDWSLSQRHLFLRLLFDLHHDFSRFLWEAGSLAQDVRSKNVFLDRMREEFGGSGTGFREQYLKLAISLGCNLADESASTRHLQTFLESYSDSQIRLIAEDRQNALVLLAAREHLHAMDCSAIQTVFETFGIREDELRLFSGRRKTHASDLLAPELRTELERNAESTVRLLESVSDFRLNLWRCAAEAICNPPIPGAEKEFAKSEAVAETRGTSYDSTKWPRLAGKFADFAALEEGDSSRLELRIDEKSLSRIHACRNEQWGSQILLFGATGFVGCHLLHRLLQRPQTEKVYAVVRARAGISAWDRIAAALRKYELLDSLPNADKITLMDGDFATPAFGLGERQYSSLAARIDTVIQAAGSTDYLPPYEELRRDWVLGLLGTMQFCLEERVKQLVYIGSTIAHLFQKPEDFQRPDSWWYSGYAQMKWVNQQMMYSLARRGMRAQVCESPYVLGSLTAGRDPGYVYSFWREVALAAALQVSWDGPFPAFAAVDVLADAVIANAFAHDPLPVIRPIAPYDLRNADVAPYLDCRVLPWPDFLNEVSRHATPEQLRMIPADRPELIRKTNLPPIYPASYKVPEFPPSQELARLYLTKLGILDESRRNAPHF